MSQELSDKEVSIAFDKLKITLKTEGSINENSNNLDDGIKFVFERLSLDPDPNNKNKSKITLIKKVFEAIDILRNKNKKRLDTKSIHELIKKNSNISISESEMKNFI